MVAKTPNLRINLRAAGNGLALVGRVIALDLHGLPERNKIGIGVFDDKVAHSVLIVLRRPLNHCSPRSDLLEVLIDSLAKNVHAPLPCLPFIRRSRSGQMDLNVAQLHARIVAEPKPLGESEDIRIERQRTSQIGNVKCRGRSVSLHQSFPTGTAIAPLARQSGQQMVGREGRFYRGLLGPAWLAAARSDSA